MAQRENTKNPIPSNSLADLNDNTIILDEWTNSSVEYTSDRFGNPILTLSKILSNYQAAVNDIQSGSFLPISGGTVTGLTNFSGGLQSGGKTVFTINGGTITGTTNFTGTLQYKDVEVLKVGDCGLGGNSPTIKDVDSASTGNGFYYGGAVTAGTLPFNYFYVIQATKADQGFQLASDVSTSALKFRRIQSGAWQSWYELITTANIANYQNTAVTVLYPNGSESSPPTISKGTRLVIDNPYKTLNCIIKVELKINDIWGECPKIQDTGSGYGRGCTATALSDDTIVIQTGGASILTGSLSDGNPWNSGAINSALYRIRLIKLGN